MISLRMISTDDKEVIRQLRELQQPAVFFSEGPAERRERLRQVLIKLGPDALEKIKSPHITHSIDVATNDKETWYHEGSELLKRSRFRIAKYSIEQCKSRLDMNMLKQLEPISTRFVPQQKLIDRLKAIDDCGSQIGDDRPLSSCNFSPDSTMIATSSWSGLCKLWSVPNLMHQHTLRGHTCNVSYITFHPQSTKSSYSSKSINLASCSVDGSVLLWNLTDEEPIINLKGHEGHKVTRVKFHPTGEFLATCCSDKSWRFWNLEHLEEILHQEGHADAVYDIAFHPDGSLAATAGLDSFGRIFDLRTGRQIMLLEGHLRGLLSIDCSPDGYHIATGSQDHSVKIWDLRKRTCEYTIPAHTNIVVKVVFEKRSGCYLATASYDKSIKFWSKPTWAPVQTLYGHDERIMGMDCSENSELFATSSYDKTFKLFVAR